MPSQSDTKLSHEAVTPSCDTKLMGCPSPHCALQGAAKQQCPDLEGAGCYQKGLGSIIA